MRLKMMIAPSAICLALLLSSCSRTNPVPQPLVLLPLHSLRTANTARSDMGGCSQLHAGTPSHIPNLRRAGGDAERLARGITKGVNSIATLNVKNH